MRDLQRSIIQVLSLAVAAFTFGCDAEQTSALIEIQSDLREELTRVDVEIRDGDDRMSVDHFSFDSSTDPNFRVPFSFRVEPGEQGATQFVVHVVGFRRDVMLAEARLKIAFVKRSQRHHVVRLSAGEDARRDDGVTGTDAGSAGSGGAGSAGDRGDAGGVAVTSDERESGGEPASGAGGERASGSGGASGSTIESGGSGAGAGSSGSTGAGSGGVAGASGTSAGGSSGSRGAGTGGASGSSGAGAGSGGASGAGTGGASGIGGATGKLLSEKDSTADVTYLGRAYVVRNGIDGSGLEQTIRYENTSFTVMSVTGAAQAGTAWPVVYYGHLYGKASMDTNLPLRVDQIRNIDVSFKSNAGSISGSYALATALWFGQNTQKVDNNLPTAGMIEIWHSAVGIQLPASAPTQAAITVEGASGSYDFYAQDCFWEGQTCITYLRNPPAADFSGDLRPFVSDAMKRAPTVLGSWYLNAIITGFAIERASSGLQLREFTAAVR